MHILSDNPNVEIDAALALMLDYAEEATNADLRGAQNPAADRPGPLRGAAL